MGNRATGFTLVRTDGTALAGQPWRVDGDLDRGGDLSGIACAPDGHGFVATDEGSLLQAIRLDRTARAIGVGAMRLALLRDGEEADLEGLCWGGDCFYAIGSHSRGRVSGDHQPSRHHVYRLWQGPGDGDARHETSHALGPLLGADPILGEHYQKRLNPKRRGVNVEGLAARTGGLWLGLRSPSLDGAAFVLEVAVADLFGPDPERRHRARRHALTVGRRAGIRDLAMVPGGMLVLSGPSVDGDAAPFAVGLWGDDGSLARLAEFADLGPAKAEGLLVLAAPGDGFEIVVLFDGARRGRPHEYRLPRPA